MRGGEGPSLPGVSVVEIELKFQIEPARLDGVRRALAGRGAATPALRLHARYFDTADGRLAAAGLALRLRKEGRARWVQTLKGRGDGMMHRLEHELVLTPGVQASIQLDRHDGTPAGQALRKALGSPPAPLVERFATDIRRSRRVVRVRMASGQTALIEIALDQGRIVAPADGATGAPAPRRAPQVAVSEIEFELLSGPPQALLDLASRWTGRHGLWLDVRSKAERGHALATGHWPGAAFAGAPVLGRRMPPTRAFAAMLQSVLAHVLPNMAAVAAATHAGSDHLHQLRVGLRRLRTLLREFGSGIDGVDAAWQPLLAEVFSALGALRDREIIEQTLAPARLAAIQAGFVATEAAARAETTPEAAGAAVELRAQETAPLREPGFNALLLALIGLASATEAQAEGAPLIELASKRLSRLHKRVADDASRFAAQDDDARHDLRKRLKRLRYSLEFVAPVFPKKAVSRYLALLKPAQQALGDYNDIVVAQASLREAATRSDSDAFVLGWLTARREALAQAASAQLRRLADASRFWKNKG